MKELSQGDIRTIKNCRLFSGLEDKSLDEALCLYSAELRVLPKGAVIASEGGSLQKFGLVLSGAVCVSSGDIDGNTVIMNAVQTGGTFGESLCWLKAGEIPVRITATEDSRVLFLSPHGLACNGDNVCSDLFRRFVSMLAERTLKMNDRIQILSRKTLREKLLILFAQYSESGRNRSFILPFDRESLAVYLGVNRTALSRELSAMKRDGLIDYYKNSFKLL
ncbi:MAG: Crp/Fnr family transcriptional regulator [Clostridia bacterium]|nr:Crp/Fnr family transcriptional regulator [Clostridia bacterium]